jgi:hypothetical protein
MYTCCNCTMHNLASQVPGSGMLCLCNLCMWFATESQLSLEEAGELGSQGDGESFQERFSSDDLLLPDKQLAKKRGLEANSLGLRYPIWFAACRFERFSYELTCQGDPQRGTDFILLQSLGEPNSWVNVALQHPELNPLAFHIVKYLRNFHSDDWEIEVHACLGRPVNALCVLYCDAYTTPVLIMYRTVLQACLCGAKHVGSDSDCDSTLTGTRRH